MGNKKTNSGLEWARKKRAHVLRNIDVEKMLAELGLDIVETTSNDYIVHCPHKEHHDDSKASCAVHKERGVYFCHGCGEDGSAFDLWAKVRGVDWTRAVDELLLLVGSMPSEDDDEDDDEEDRKTISTTPKVELPPIDPVLIDSWHENLMIRSPKQKHEILNSWGIDEKTLKRFKLGWDGDRYTIPITDAAGEYRNVRRYRPNSKTGRKVLNYQQGDAKYGSPTRLFPLENLDGDKVILVEGEKDAIVASQRGFPAVTATSGATYWKEEFNELFKDKTVYICYDQDAAGQQGTEKVAHSLADVCEVLLVKLPETDEIKGFDITNYFVDYGASKEDFETLLLDAVVYAKPISEVLGEDEEEPVPVPLAAATMARYHGKPISASVVVSGKHTSPYLVPRKLRVQCWCSDPDSACATCPRWHKSKEPTKFYNERIEIRAKDPELLSLINCSEAQQKGLIRNMSGIGKGCNYGKVEVEEYGNMQQIIVIPELDQLNYDMGDSEYVSRNGYYLGHNIQANHSYRVAGYTHPDPRNQLATHVFFHKDEARDDISNFEMTPDLFSELSETFRPEKGESIEDKLTDIYNYLTKHVHFIRGRPELQLAFDLVWHSVLTFDFMNQPVRKGWLEGLVIGDTSQGKRVVYTTPVLTPEGWRQIGDLVVGDQVYGRDGKPHNVTETFRERRPLYRVTFSDGSWVDADAEHLWAVTGPKRKYKYKVGKTPWEFEILTTQQILEKGLKLPSGRGFRFQVPMVAPVEFPEADVPIDPYTLGVLIGDGTYVNGTPAVTTDDETVEKLVFPGDVTARHQTRLTDTVSTYGLSERMGRTTNPLTEALRELDLYGKTSHYKFVPEMYKWGSVEQRLAILQGLLDTDGHVRKGTVSFSTSSEQLGKDVQHLVWSLGGTANLCPHSTRENEYTVYLRLPLDMCPFRLTRRKEAWTPDEKCEPVRAIVSIEPVGEDDGVCIAVDAEDHLYVVKDFVVTHNTELTSRMRDYYNLGARITGEKTSSAGLVGGLQKMGDQWILQWGAYPQQDRRAMLIDEYSSLSEEDIANMTDLRSTGIAEIVKVRTERTRARVRTLACSNSRPGRMLKTYMHSITAIQELMGKAEDTRRLDFALSVATGEVDIMLMNRPVSAIPNSKKEYPADLCRQLVLFAWSRNLHPATGQVVFTKAAEGAILIAAKELGEKYHPKIPLVEPSDQRLKLARMATSLAARLFSTDAIGEAIVVDEEHVNYVVAWLQAQYDKPSMGYNTWSEEQWRGDRFEKDVPELITKHILQMPHGFEAVMFLATQSRAFRINDMMASCNMMREEAGEIMQVLVRHAAVANTSGGFRPNPNLNELLRSLRNGEEIGGLKLEDFSPEKRKASPFATGTVPTP